PLSGTVRNSRGGRFPAAFPWWIYRRGSGRFARQPVAWHEVVAQARLGAAVLRLEAVFPAHARGQAHQDRLGPATALQAEQRAAVVDQVELDVAAAAVELELALALAIGGVLATLHDRQVGIEEAVADRAQVGEVALEVFVQVVEEQATHAAGLVAVLEEEVVVAPALVALVAVRAERGAEVGGGAVPVHHVLVERIERGQVEAAAEPPGHGLAVAPGLEVAHVGVGGGQVGIARVEHQRDAGGAPGGARQLGAGGAGRWRQAAAGDVGEADAGLLEHRAVAQYPGTPATGVGAASGLGRAGPGVLDEPGLAVRGLDRRADTVLQAGQIVPDEFEIRIHGRILAGHAAPPLIGIKRPRRPG